MNQRACTRAVAAVASALAILCLVPAALGSPRTFVSTSGNDANACSLAAPCRGFAKAITVTDPGGELVVLDSGGYGSVIVNKNVTITSPAGVYAGISVPAASDGVTVTSPATKVVLRGLTVNGQGGGNNGIRIQTGEVHVENAVISNMGAAGVLVEGGTSVRISGSVSRSNVDGLRVIPGAGTVGVVVRDSELSNNATAGIGISPSAAGASAHVTVERSSVTKNGAGLSANPTGAATAELVVTQSVASENAGAGVSSTGAGATVYVRESAITRNGTGLLQASSGVLNACGANLLVANGTAQSGSINTSSCLDVANSGGTVTSVATGTGLTGGPITTAGTVSLDPQYQLPQPAVNNQTLRYDAVGSGSWVANPLLLARQDGGVVMTGTLGAGTAPASGAGGRLMWYPGKAAFRAGYATGTQWDDPNIGIESVGLGYNTVASGGNSTSIGGTSTANGTAATTIGWNNIASGSYATAIGKSNTAAANNSVAMGQLASTAGGQAGSFVYADSQNFAFGSPISNEFAVRATGGARFVTDIDVSGNPQQTVALKPGGVLDFGANTRQMINLWNNEYGIGVQSLTTYFRSNSTFCWFVGGTHSDGYCDPGTGISPMLLAPGDGGFGNGAPFTLGVDGNINADNHVYAQDFIKVSDRALKAELEPVEGRDILRKVARLPISTWVFKSSPQTRHIGPMAQDFGDAFRVGVDDKHIGSIDAEGVALAAIQGLYAELKDRDAIISAQKAEIATHESRIAEEQSEIAELRERLAQAESLRGELAELKSAVASLAGRSTVAARSD
jgi:hypothetical protein